jgi:hypothetical protein
LQPWRVLCQNALDLLAAKRRGRGRAHHKGGFDVLGGKGRQGIKCEKRDVGGEAGEAKLQAEGAVPPRQEGQQKGRAPGRSRCIQNDEPHSPAKKTTEQGGQVVRGRVDQGRTRQSQLETA